MPFFTHLVTGSSPCLKLCLNILLLNEKLVCWILKCGMESVYSKQKPCHTQKHSFSASHGVVSFDTCSIHFLKNLYRALHPDCTVCTAFKQSHASTQATVIAKWLRLLTSVTYLGAGSISSLNLYFY